MNNLPKVVAEQRRGRASNPRLLDRKSDALPLSHRATRQVFRKNIPGTYQVLRTTLIFVTQLSDCDVPVTRRYLLRTGAGRHCL